jgi:hypothetical protein
MLVLFGLFYLMRVLEPEDHSRFKLLISMLPKSIAEPMETVLTLLIRMEPRRVNPTNV